MRRTLLVLCVLLALGQPCQAETRWALVVGIDTYESGDISPLRFAGADARAMAQALQKSCGFAAEHVVLMTSDDSGLRRPTCTNVLRWLEGLKASVKPDDTFVFFFAGHGVAENGESYLLTCDTSASSDVLLRKTSLGVKEMEGALHEIKAARVIQFVDACRTDPRAGRAAGDNRLSRVMSRDLTLVRTATASPSAFTATLFACQEGQRSYEGCEGHGYFTWYLIKALGGDATDVSGNITLSSVVAYLEKRVPEAVMARESGHAQTPWATFSGAGALSWAFASKGAAAVAGPCSVTVSFPPNGFRSTRADINLTGVVFGPDRPASVDIAINGRPVALPGGVQITARGAMINAPLTLQGGENRIVVSTRDVAGRSGRAEVVVYRDGAAVAPGPSVAPSPVAAATPRPSRPPSPVGVATPSPILRPSRPARPSPAAPPSPVAVTSSSPPPLAVPSPVAGPTSSDPNRVAVSITCAHPLARVWVDQVLVARGPTTVALSRGPHEVWVSADETAVPWMHTIQVSGPMKVDVVLTASALAHYRAGLAAWQAGDMPRAAAAFTASVKAPGKQVPETHFYLGYLAFKENRFPDAESALLTFLNVHDDSATAHYVLGLVRQKMGKPLATTAFKSAAMRLLHTERGVLDELGTVNADTVARTQQSAASGEPRARLQYAYALEQQGQLSEARDLYRLLCESLMQRDGVKPDVPLPKGSP